jgi:iron-sulfur cluster assembly accessory protein
MNILTLTEIAETKVTQLLESENADSNLRLRIAVMPGGCAGMQYDLFFDNNMLEGDVIAKQGNVEVVVDKNSVELLKGSVLDYADGLSGQGFSIDNPNASSGCGCGKSFC